MAASTLSKDVILNILGQIEEYQAAAAQIPGVSEKAAASAALKMQAVFVKQAKDQVKVQKDAATKIVQVHTDAAKTVEKSFSSTFATAARAVTQNQLVSQVETVGALFIQLGGNVSRAASIFTSAVRPITIMKEVLGATGAQTLLVVGSLASFAAAIAIVDYSIYSLGQKAVSAYEELKSFGVEVGPEKTRQIESYGAAVHDLTINMDKAAIATGSWVAEDLAALNKGMSDALFLTLKWTGALQDNVKAQDGVKMAAGTNGEAIEETKDTTNGWLDTLKGVNHFLANPFMGTVNAVLGKYKEENRATVLASESSKQFGDVMVSMGKHTAEANKQLGEQVEHTKKLAQVGQDATTQLKNEIEAEQALARARAASAREAQKYATEREKFATLSRKVTDDYKKDEEKVMDAEAANMAELDGIYAKGVLSAKEYGDTRAAIEKQTQDKLSDIRSKAYYKESNEAIANYIAFEARNKAEADKIKAAWMDVGKTLEAAFFTAFAGILDGQATLAQQRVSDGQAEVDALTTQQKDLADKMKEARKDIADYESKQDHTAAETKKYLAEKAALIEQESQQKAIDATMKAKRLALNADKQNARDVAATQRGLAVFQIALDTALAIGKTIATWGPPPSPLGIAGIAAATALGAAQATAILAQPMPTFYQGVARTPGGSGEVQATLHGGEAVLNSRAANNLGPQIIDALNAGLSPLMALQGGGGGDVYIDGQAVGRVMAGQARKAGAFGNAVRSTPVGFANPYGRYR